MVLIIEVGGWNCGMLPILLDQAGYEPLVVRGLQDAVDLIERRRPALIIVGGRADAQFYRAIRRVSLAPILALAAWTDDERTLAAFAAGVDDVQADPIGHEEIVLRVRAILRFRRRQNLQAEPAGGTCR